MKLLKHKIFHVAFNYIFVRWKLILSQLCDLLQNKTFVLIIFSLLFNALNIQYNWVFLNRGLVSQSVSKYIIKVLKFDSR